LQYGDADCKHLTNGDLPLSLYHLPHI
jgi:hypothetical protein